MMNVYQPSGKFKPAVFAYALGGAVVAAGLAWIYQLLIDLIPLIYLNLVVTGGFAVALVAIGGLIVNAGHCRNVVVGVAASLIVGVGGVGASHYFAYSSVISSIVEEEGLDEAQAEALKQELSFGVYIEARVETGWSVSRRGRGAPSSTVCSSG